VRKSRQPSHQTPRSQGYARANPASVIKVRTKASFKTTEMIVYVLSVLGVLIASEVMDDGDFNAKQAWFFVTLLTIGYMVSRGLAKSGSRDFYDPSFINLVCSARSVGECECVRRSGARGLRR
jgi:hypothetical protein